MSKFTKEQEKVINHTDGSIMVTASAGSGKTRVMVERFIKLVTEGKARVREVLAVTFTRLAAGELKERLKKALYEKIREGGENAERLKEEIDDLPVADISTIDSFCSNVVRRYFYIAGVSPSFKVLDPSEASAIKEKAAQETLEKLYEENDEDLRLLLKVFRKKRSDKALITRIIALYDFADSEKDGVFFFDRYVDNYTVEGAKRVENELIGLYIKKFKALTKPFYALRTRAFEMQTGKYVEYCSSFISYMNLLEEEPDLNGLSLYLSADRAKPTVKTKDDPLKKALSDDISFAKEKIVKVVTQAKNTFCDEDRYEKVSATLPIVKALVRVTKLFAEEYMREKADASALDYGDLEHLCYKVLQSDEAREEIAGSYKYVFVDEYQDTNGIQEAIFSLIERDNIFVVGDVKQSIYGFRGSDSDIFLNGLKKHEADGKTTVNLSVNFRSTKGVLSCVNNVFGDIMTNESFGIDYAAEPMLYGGLYGDYSGSAAICRLSLENQTEKDDLGVYGVLKHLEKEQEEKPVGEENLVRLIVEQNIGQEYFDPSIGKTRPITFKDIAVLTRTNSGLSDRIVGELARGGIPVISDSKRSIGEYPEINLVVGILKTVSTAGRDDIALACALKSPLGNLTDAEMYAVRAADETKDDSFYTAAKKYDKDDVIGEKLNDFFDYLEELRLFSAFSDAATVLRKIVADKKIDLELLSEPLGEFKVRRLERFIAECSKLSLTVEGFLSRADELLKDMTVSVSGGDSSVKVMSIHASKGLEFPVVILTELDRQLYSIDKRDEIFLDRKAGIGVKYYDFDTRISGANLVRDYVGFIRADATARDETRLLYVAMTRAEYKLYMVTTSEVSEERNGSEAAYAGKASNFLCMRDCDYFEYTKDDLLLASADTLPSPSMPLVGENQSDVKIIERFLSFKYPYEDDLTLSLKKTVTEINQKYGDEDERVESVYPDEKPFGAKTAEEGNAYHKFLQYALFGGNATEEIERIFSGDVLTEEEKSLMDKTKLKEILSNAVYKTLSGYELFREQPFIAFVPPEKAKEVGREPVLVQGVIDLLAIKDDEAVIVDYKYSAKSDEKLAESYREQLLLYAYAVENVLHKKVTHKYLFNLNRSRLVEVE